MDSYQVVIDSSMIRNIMQTDLHESLDLLTPKLIGYFLFLGILPSYFVYKAPIYYRGLKKELMSKLIMLSISAILMVASLYLFSKHYTSFMREHKPLRYSVNPDYWIYSIGKYINRTYNSEPITLQSVGTDAKVAEKSSKKLIIIVVGEAARADHFSLNGYSRETNPLLEKLDVINFPNLYSCGTATAESVPCMFSKFDRGSFNYRRGITYENVLDVIKHTDRVTILWRDNNSDSKGVALRVGYEDYRTSTRNRICEESGECRDSGMLIGLDRYISDQNGSSTLIILHQMGNHGPAYYKRYPKEFEKFTPVCQTNQLERCSREEISNAYDNAILYTDTFLSKTISFLKRYESEYQVGLIYMADHGESLGENGLYLHGMPYFMAPDAQKHVAALIWFGRGAEQRVDIEKLKQKAAANYSHDNLFHTLLGLFSIDTEVYDPRMDILNGTYMKK